MQDFVFTSKKFVGTLRFTYNEKGILESFRNDASLTPEQINYFQGNFPFRKENLERIKGKDGRIQEVTDISFERFWNDYGYKVDRKKAEEAFNKLDESKKLLAIIGIPRYKINCKKKNVAMIYAVRYLKYERYLDED